jgi:hypothetical protein
MMIRKMIRRANRPRQITSFKSRMTTAGYERLLNQAAPAITTAGGIWRRSGGSIAIRQDKEKPQKKVV